MATLTDEDILARLTAVEDSTTERKPIADSRGWLKTAVAFSNSLRDDQPGVLFVGVNDNGTIQEKDTNFEDLLRKVSGELGNIYPPINPTILVREKEGKSFLAVIIYGSPLRPHFAGKSYVRSGTQTIEASDVQFERLIAQRTGKVAEITKWAGQEVTVQQLYPREHRDRLGRVAKLAPKVIKDCNQHWLSLAEPGKLVPVVHYPLSDVTLSFDGQRLMLIVEW